MDNVKKHAIYGKPLDRENALEEMGDMEFAAEALRQEFGFTRQQVLEANVAKLSKRYPNGAYSNADAIARADKVSNA